MEREIKTVLSLDGEKEYNRALKDAQRNLRVMSADLRAVGAEFQATGNAERYMTQKSELLKNKIKQQELIVKSLEGAVKDSARSYGDASAKTDGYRIKLSNATAQLYKMRQELEDADREMEEFGRDAKKAGRQIEDGLAESAEKAGNSIQDMMGQMSADLGAIKGSMLFEIGGKVAGGLMQAGEAVVGIADETREGRRKKATLKSNVEEKGWSWDEALEDINRVAAITGDMDDASEMMHNFVQMGYDGQQRDTAIEYMLGIWRRFNGTLSPGQLAESAQETAASGELTGQYAEALGRLGMTDEELEAFGQALKGKTIEERQAAVLTRLAGFGLPGSMETYEEENKDMIAGERASIELESAKEDFGEAFEPVSTEIKSGFANFLGALVTTVNAVKEDPLKVAAAATTGAASRATDVLEIGMNPIQSVGNFIGRKIGEALLSESEYSNSLDAAFEEMPTVDGVQYSATEMYDFEEFMKWQQSIGATDYKDSPMYQYWLQVKGGGGGTQMQEVGQEDGTAYAEGVAEGIENSAEEMKTAGENAATELANGIMANGQAAVNAALSVASAVAAAFGSIGGGITGGMVGYPGLNITGDVNIDGKTAGKILAPSVSKSLGQMVGQIRRTGQ